MSCTNWRALWSFLVALILEQDIDNKEKNPKYIEWEFWNYVGNSAVMKHQWLGWRSLFRSISAPLPKKGTFKLYLKVHSCRMRSYPFEELPSGSVKSKAGKILAVGLSDWEEDSTRHLVGEVSKWGISFNQPGAIKQLMGASVPGIWCSVLAEYT